MASTEQDILDASTREEPSLNEDQDDAAQGVLSSLDILAEAQGVQEPVRRPPGS
jgi:hypothetical protein